MIEGLFQPMHLLVIFGIALLVFGPKKLPELGKGIGDGIRGFKTAIKQILEFARKLPEHAFEDDGVTYYRITPAYRKAMEDLERELNSFTIVDGKVIAVDSDAKKP